MNERIKKLHDQAFAETTDYYATMQRFSELIVKECTTICKNNWEDRQSWGEHYAQKIQKHFGVN